MLNRLRAELRKFLAAALTVAGAAGCLLSRQILSTPSEAGSSLLFGFSPQRLLLWGQLFGLGAVCLVAAGAVMRSERFFRTLTRFFRPSGRRVAQHLLGGVMLAAWVLVFWWEGCLSQLFPRLDPMYHRAAPVFVWALLASALFYLLSRVHWSLDGPEPPSQPPSESTVLSTALSILLAATALIGYIYLLKVGVPRQIAVKFRYDFLPILLPLLFIAAAAVAHPRRWGGGLGFLVILPLFGLTLTALWMTGASEDPIVAGLYPWMDPSSYYSDALRLANGLTTLTNWGGRPIFEVFLALLLQLTDQNLQASLGILVAVNAVCAVWLAREITRQTNELGGAFSLVLYFFYYRQFSGTTLTENLGLPVGALALVFLLSGARQRRVLEQVWGIFLLSLALNIRPASMLMIPAAGIWFALQRSGKKQRILGLALAGAAAAAGFGVNTGLNTQVSPAGDAVLFSRFPNTLYGVAMGGKDWNQVNVDYPELNELKEPELSRRIYALAFQAVLDNPLRFTSGALQMAGDLFKVDQGAFVFVRGAARPVVFSLRGLLYLLGGLALFWAVPRRKTPSGSLLLWLAAGLVLSCPFVPPRDSDRMRTYAAVMPLIFLLPALGSAWLVKGFQPFQTEMKSNPLPPRSQPHREPGSRVLELGASGLFIAAVISALFWVRLQALPVLASAPPACPEGQTALMLEIRPGSYLRLVPADSQAQTHFPDLRINDYEHSVREFSYRSVFAAEPVQPDTYLLNTIDLRTGEMLWVSLSAGGAPISGRRPFAVCAQKKGGPQSLFWYAEYSPE